MDLEYGTFAAPVDLDLEADSVLWPGVFEEMFRKVRERAEDEGAVITEGPPHRRAAIHVVFYVWPAVRERR